MDSDSMISEYNSFILPSEYDAAVAYKNWVEHLIFMRRCKKRCMIE